MQWWETTDIPISHVVSCIPFGLYENTVDILLPFLNRGFAHKSQNLKNSENLKGRMIKNFIHPFNTIASTEYEFG